MQGVKPGTARKVDTLTAHQWGEVRRLRGEWLAAGLSAAPADRPAAENAIARLYEMAGKQPPQFLWTDSPATALLAIWLVRTYWLRHGEAYEVLQDVLDEALGPSLRASLLYSLRASLGGASFDSLRALHGRDHWAALSIGEQLRDRLYLPLANSIYSAVTSRLDFQLRSALYRPLEASLSDSLRGPLLGSLQESLYTAVVDPLSRLAGDTESRAGSSLHGSLAESLHFTRRLPGQHDYQVGAYDVAARLGICGYRDQQASALELRTQLARSCGWWWPHLAWCVISERPRIVRTEPWDPELETVRLHAVGGPAMEFGDGWQIHAWHGRRVPAWVTEAPTFEAIGRESNAEARRCAIEVLGWDKFTSSKWLQQVGRPVADPGNPGQELRLFDVSGELWGTAVRMLLCTNGSMEPDGTRRQYGLVVPPDTEDPLAAAAWTAGLPPDEYARLVRRT